MLQQDQKKTTFRRILDGIQQEVWFKQEGSSSDDAAKVAFNPMGSQMSDARAAFKKASNVKV